MRCARNGSSFLTDVAGVMDNGGRVIPRLDARGAEQLRASGVARGGMLPKLAACLDALADSAVPIAHIVDGREPGAVMNCVNGRPMGTRITP